LIEAYSDRGKLTIFPCSDESLEVLLDWNDIRYGIPIYGPGALVTILGATGIWLLLPHRHGQMRREWSSLLGALFTAIAIVSLIVLCRPPAGFITAVSFYGFALTALIAAVCTITSRDPIYSALWFAAVVLATSGLFLLCGAQFLAAGTIIVYAGAIIVTFLFVIMLAQREGRATYDRMARSPGRASLTGFLVLWSVLFALQISRYVDRFDPAHPRAIDSRLIPASHLISGNMLEPNMQVTQVIKHALSNTNRIPEADPKGEILGRHVAGLGGTLFNDHLVTVELAGALLFAALIGALAIASPKPPIRPGQRTTVINPPPPST
jgi:NADH-quinone oxidoreductase subunit J